MSQLKLSVVASTVAAECGTVLSSAVNAENTARDRWKKTGKAFYNAGARVEALHKGTEDAPNPAQDDSLIQTIERMIVEALSATKKPEKFKSGTYTVGEIMGLTREQLRDADDASLSRAKREYRQDVGSLFNLVRKYVDKVQYPDKVREPKAKKAEAPTESTDPIVIIQGFVTNATKMVGAANVDAFKNAGLEMIALIRAQRSAAK